MGRARQLADRYVDRVDAGDLDGIVALFADNAELLNPFGHFAGSEQIRGFYEKTILAVTPRVTAAGWIEQDNRIAFELQARVDGYDAVQYAMDHLTVAADGDHIARMALYYRQVSQ
ncbi:nuclear transport factor 2 family protein [Nocardia sp. NPDC059228]|uniref:nuclear transport factor 2 family protein n=1 Tax=Nocardia sp. NPDC059228 TaxID=3346777 RepID=UPI0036B337BD